MRKGVEAVADNMGNIRTERLIIRLALPEDADNIFSYRSDFDANRYQGWFPESPDEVRDYIMNMPHTMDVADTWFQFAIITVREDRLIGDMALCFSNHDNMQAEIGCTLDKDFQGMGYATEAVEAMTEYLFGTLKKRRIVCSVDPRNTSSIRLMQRLGFRKEAHFRESYYHRGEWADDIIYALLQKEWAELRSV